MSRNMKDRRCVEKARDASFDFWNFFTLFFSYIVSAVVVASLFILLQLVLWFLLLFVCSSGKNRSAGQKFGRNTRTKRIIKSAAAIPKTN